MKEENKTTRFSFRVNDKNFKTSSYTNRGGIINRCVRVLVDKKGVAIRDSKNEGKKKQTTLFFNKEEWKAFTDGVKNNEFNI